MFNMEIPHKMLRYAFLNIQAQQAREIYAAVSFSLYLLLKWMLQLFKSISAKNVDSNKVHFVIFLIINMSKK